jgi:hypothetical protein
MMREELAVRIEAFKRDLPRLNVPVVAEAASAMASHQGAFASDALFTAPSGIVNLISE